MLKTYRIIPLVFILFLFGLLLTGVSPATAQENERMVPSSSVEKRDCERVGGGRVSKINRNCWRGYARDLEAALTEAQGAGQAASEDEVLETAGAGSDAESPVSAEGSPEFIECNQMPQPTQSGVCFRKLVISLQAQLGERPEPVASTPPASTPVASAPCKVDNTPTGWMPRKKYDDHGMRLKGCVVTPERDMEPTLGSWSCGARATSIVGVIDNKSIMRCFQSGGY